MTAAELKASILDRAVRGLLVPQRDEEKFETFERFEKFEKSRTSAASSQTSQTSDTSQTSPVPYDLPQGWVWKTIPEVTAFQEGPGIGKKDFRSKGIPLIRIAGMHDTVVHLTGCNYLDPEMVAAKWNHFKLDIGDTVISTSASLDKIAVVDQEAEGAIPYTGLIRFKMSAQLERAYFHWFIQSPIYIQQIDKLKKGDAIKHYGPSHLQQMVIPLPPLAEQKRIVAKIEELMPLVEEYGKAEAELAALNDNFPTALRKSILQHAVEGKLTAEWRRARFEKFEGFEKFEKLETAADLLEQIRKSRVEVEKCRNGRARTPAAPHPITDDEKPFPIPESWEWVRLNDIFNFIDYRGKTPNKIDAGVPLVTAKNVRQGYMDYSVKDFISEKEFTERQSRGIAKKGDILFTTEAPLGFAAIADLERFSSGQRLIAFQQYTDNPLLDNKAFMYFLLAPEWQKYLYSKRTGTTVAGIKAEFLKELLIPLPPLAEQKAIVARVEELLKLVEEMKE